MLETIIGVVAGEIISDIAKESGVVDFACDVAADAVDFMFDPITGSSTSCQKKPASAPRTRRPAGQILVSSDKALHFWSEPKKKIVCITNMDDFAKKSKNLLAEHKNIETIFRKAIGRLIIGDTNKIVVHAPKPGFFNRIDLHLKESTPRKIRIIEMARAIAATYTHNVIRPGVFSTELKSYAHNPYQVDQFAACLLMPNKKEIRSIMSGIPTRASQIGTIVQRYHVLENWVEFRLKCLDL